MSELSDYIDRLITQLNNKYSSETVIDETAAVSSNKFEQRRREIKRERWHKFAIHRAFLSANQREYTHVFTYGEGADEVVELVEHIKEDLKSWAKNTQIEIYTECQAVIYDCGPSHPVSDINCRAPDGLFSVRGLIQIWAYTPTPEGEELWKEHCAWGKLGR